LCSATVGAGKKLREKGDTDVEPDHDSHVDSTSDDAEGRVDSAKHASDEL